MASSKSLIKSKERVQKHGEVFTPKWVVKDMLALLPNEILQNLSATYLEPSCGEGAFLIEIYKQKLNIANKISKNLDEWEFNAFKATTSIYGVELLEDNLAVCKENLERLFVEYYEKACNKYNGKQNDKTKESIIFVINTNIVQGNFLKPETIMLSEWNFNYVQRKEYPLVEKVQQISMFPEYENEIKPIRTFRPTFWKEVINGK